MIILLPRKILFGKFSWGWCVFCIKNRKVLCGGNIVCCLKYLWNYYNVK